MADWPPVAPVQPTVSREEREKIYLMLVDMFVDNVDPEIIHMVLQNHDWNRDAALEDIMTLANTSQPSLAQNVNKTYSTPKVPYQAKTKKSTASIPRQNGLPFNKSNQSFSVSQGPSTPQAASHFQQRRPANDRLVQAKFPEMKKENQAELQPFIDQYNFIKATRTPFEKTVMLIKDGVKVMIILRGVPGSGKSTLAKKLLLESGIEHSSFKRHIFSTDDFFVQNKVYIFVPELLSEAHLWNQRSVAAAIREEVSPIIVDNTNTQAWEMRVYADMAVSAGYDLEVLEPDTWWFKKGSVSELEKRNIHSVPKAKIRQMLERYEKNITSVTLMKQFNLQYPLSKAPPQPSRNCKWRDKLSNQRNNKPKKKKRDFSPKPNLDNINTMSQSFQINSSGYSQFGNELKVQNSAVTNVNFPPKVSPFVNESTIKGDSISYSKETATEELAKISPGYVNGDNGLSLDVSNTNKLFDDIVINSNSFLKALGGQSIKETKKTNGAFSGNMAHQGKDSFDFMAETKKLLDALNRPLFSHEQAQKSKEVHANETLENLDCLEADVQGKKRNILPDKQYNNLSQFLPTNNLTNDINSSHDLTDSVVDKALGHDGTKVLNSSHSTVKLEKVDQISERGLSWDYVVVNSDNTFIYQRKNSIPFGLPVVINDGVSSSNTCVANNVTTLTNSNDLVKTNDEIASAILSGDDSSTIDNGSCNIVLDTNKNEDSLFLNSLDSKSDSGRDTKINTIEACDNSELNFNSEPEVMDNTVNFHGRQNYLSRLKREESKNIETNCADNPNVLEMMKEILCTLKPLNKSDSNLGSNASSNMQETKISNISGHGGVIPRAKISNETNFSGNLLQDSLDNWAQTDTTDNSAYESSKPKPARNLRRPKLLINAAEHQFNENDFSKYFGDWGTVSNPAESWAAKKTVDDSAGINDKTSALPQRSSRLRSKNIETTDSSSNTNYLDFTLANEENVTGVKILIGNINNILSENTQNMKQNVAGFLDKSTMTVEESATPICSYDISQIKHLLPNIPEKYILHIVEKCQGDIDWAVDVLLDSEHNIAPVSIESEDDSSSSDDEAAEPTTTLLEIDNTKESLKQDSKSPTQEQTELKKMLESSVVFDRSHYSDKVLKVLKRKHPEYVQLIENSSEVGEITVEKAETTDSPPEEYKSEDEIDEAEEESSSSGCEVETEDDTMDLAMNSDLILQLQQTFGSSVLPKVTGMTPIVKMPLSFARQLFGYIMDSLQSDMDQQQSLIEDMISRDEEVARLLQFQDQASKPQLQEVMDMEIALAMHKADQEEWNAKGNEETMAAKLSKNILMEKFPQVDPKMLKEVLQAHNFSLSDTVDSLTLGLGVAPVTTSESSSKEPPKEEKGRLTPIIVSDELGASGGSSSSHAEEAAAHRAQAAGYYSLRMECLSKAQDAFRSGNKTVATYYSQLAQIHKDRMDKSNSKAAACLFSSHKTGANTLDLHFLHIREAEVVLDMFLDEVVTYISERKKRHQVVFLITGRGLRSVGGVSRIKPMVQRKLQGRGIPYNEVNPGMLSAVVRNVTPLSYTL